MTIAAATTFRVVAEEWLAKVEREGRAEITMRKSRWLLDLAYPTIGGASDRSITPPELFSRCETSKRKGTMNARAACGVSVAASSATRSPRDARPATLPSICKVRSLLRRFSTMLQSLTPWQLGPYCVPIDGYERLADRQGGTPTPRNGFRAPW